MASDVQRWFDSEARQTEAIARAERDRLRASRDHLASLLERSRPFMQDATHSVGCGAGCSWVGGDCYADHDHICTCGLADLLTEMENG